MADIVIPEGLQITMDDLGWFCGNDDRGSGGASRTGMPGYHCAKDYEAVSDPRGLPVTKGIFGCHWPNVLNMNSQRHGETVDKWAEYFNKCAESFGIVLSRDMEFFATQALYGRYAETTECNGVWSVDITDVPLVPGRGKSFCISSKKKLSGCVGGEMEIYEERENFINYRVTPDENALKFI